MAEATDLGVSFFVVAGGEPFMREELLDIAETRSPGVFLVFTNGLLLDDAMVDRIARLQEHSAADKSRRLGGADRRAAGRRARTSS